MTVNRRRFIGRRPAGSTRDPSREIHGETASKRRGRRGKFFLHKGFLARARPPARPGLGMTGNGSSARGSAVSGASFKTTAWPRGPPRWGAGGADVPGHPEETRRVDEGSLAGDPWRDGEQEARSPWQVLSPQRIPRPGPPTHPPRARNDREPEGARPSTTEGQRRPWKGVLQAPQRSASSCRLPQPGRSRPGWVGELKADR